MHAAAALAMRSSSRMRCTTSRSSRQLDHEPLLSSCELGSPERPMMSAMNEPPRGPTKPAVDICVCATAVNIHWLQAATAIASGSLVRRTHRPLPSAMMSCRICMSHSCRCT